jgi:hypothetical protein
MMKREERQSWVMQSEERQSWVMQREERIYFVHQRNKTGRRSRTVPVGVAY